MASNNTAQGLKKQLTAAEIRQLLRDFDNNVGMSVQDFCEKIGLEHVYISERLILE